MKYDIICTLFAFSVMMVGAKTKRDCRTQYVWCRAEAHCSCDGFYTRLQKCKRNYQLCKQCVNAQKIGRCKNREWRNSFYFLG